MGWGAMGVWIAMVVDWVCRVTCFVPRFRSGVWKNKYHGVTIKRRQTCMKLISWNVNGLRACLTHGFAESFAALDADIFSVQETKMQPGQADFAPEGYTEYTYSAEKKGYSGTACWCKTAAAGA